MGTAIDDYNNLDKMRAMATHGLVLAASIRSVMNLIDSPNDDWRDIARATLIDSIDHYYACARSVKHSS